MDIIAITGLCRTACIISKVLEKNGGEIKTVLTISAACVVIAKIVGELSQVQSVIKELFFHAQMSEEYLTIIFKGLGICYLTHRTGRKSLYVSYISALIQGGDLYC